MSRSAIGCPVESSASIAYSSAVPPRKVRSVPRCPSGRSVTVYVALLSTAFASVVLADDTETLAVIDGVFGDLLAGVYVAAIVGMLVGLAVAVWRRRRLRGYPTRWGVGIAALSALLAYAVASTSLSTLQSQRGSTELLSSGDSATDYDKLCRAFRETPANAIGLVDVYRYAFRLERLDNVVPLTPWAVRLLAYGSAALLAITGFLVAYLCMPRRFVR